MKKKKKVIKKKGKILFSEKYAFSTDSSTIANSSQKKFSENSQFFANRERKISPAQQLKKSPIWWVISTSGNIESDR